MPSAHEERFANARTVALRWHGQAIAYQQMGAASGQSITAIVCAEASELLEMNDQQRTLMRQRQLEIPTAELPWAPGRGDRATIDGEVWTVQQVFGIEAGIAHVLAVCPQRTDHGGRRLPR